MINKIRHFDLNWFFRVKFHKFLAKSVFLINKFIVHSFINSKDTIEIRENHSNYDAYPSCHYWEKKFCPVNRHAKYTLYLKGRGYIFDGDTISECYGKAVSIILGREGLYFPVGLRITKKSIEHEKKL